MRKILYPLFYFMFFSFLFSGCRKEEQKEIETYPVFGTCEPVTAKGGISQSIPDSSITFMTSGGGKVLIDQKRHIISISHKDYPKLQIQFWGIIEIENRRMNSAYHESLNSKRIKHKNTAHRTIVFPDGAKFTMLADSAFAPLKAATFYDGNECHHINLICNKLEYSSSNSSFAKQIDDTEPDGETATFEFTETGLLFVNIYTEEIAGEVNENRVLLGELFRDNPKHVNDYYDESTPPKDKVLTDIIRSQDVAELEAQGMILYDGTNPPIINGRIKLSPYRFDYAKPSLDIAIGKILNDVSVEVSDQVAGKQDIKVSFVDNFLKDESISSQIIIGSGNNFTLCIKTNEMKNVEGLLVFKNYAYLISGTTDGATIKNVKLARVGLKESIPNADSPSVEGNIEIYSDSDGKSEWTNL